MTHQHNLERLISHLEGLAPERFDYEQFWNPASRCGCIAGTAAMEFFPEAITADDRWRAFDAGIWTNAWDSPIFIAAQDFLDLTVPQAKDLFLAAGLGLYHPDPLPYITLEDALFALRSLRTSEDVEWPESLIDRIQENREP